MDNETKRVLLVEDNRADAALLRAMLEGGNASFEITWVERLKLALEQLAGGSFDAVLLDLSLPDSYGLNTLERLQEVEQGIPIVIVTGREDEELAMSAIRRGAQDYLVKDGLTGRAIARAIQYAMDRKRAEQALRHSEARFRLLSETAAKLLSAEDPQAVVNALCREVMAFLDCQFFFNFLAGEPAGGAAGTQAGRLRLNAYAGISEAEARKIDWLDYGVAVCGCAARDGCRIVAEDVQNTADPRTELVKSYGVRAYACHPLLAPGQVIGTLSFGTQTRSRFSEDDLALMKTVADQVAVAMQRLLAQRAIERAKNEWERTFDTVPDLIAILDDRHRVVRANRAMASKLGCTPAACIGVSCFEVVHGCTTPPEICPHAQTLKDGREHTAELHEARWGGDFLVTTTPLKDAHGRMTGSVHVARDITARKRREEQLQKLNRALNALGHSGQALIRATGETDFLNEACRIVAQDCGYAMVWIGFAEDDPAQSVRPAAWAGFEAGYLATLDLTWADTERGRGPTGTAIRTGQVCRCLDILADPKFLPWREEARKRGYASSLALPLLAGGKAFGALTIYAREPTGFDEEELKLLAELAADFAHGITALRTRAAKERAETELLAMQQREKEDAVRLAWGQSAVDTVNAMREGVVLHELDGAIISVNPAVERLTGLLGGAIVGRNIEAVLPDVLSGNNLKTARHGLAVVRHGEIPELPPMLLRRPDGKTFHVLPSVSLMDAPEGGRRVAVLTLKDVTELHEASQRLEQSERKYRELVENANSIIMRITPDHIITFFNEYAQTFFGYQAAEVLGRSVIGTIVPEVDVEGRDLRQMMREITAQPELYASNTNENRCKDGRRVWVHWSNRAIRNDQGEVYEILCVGADITQRRELETEARRYQQRLRELAERLAMTEEEDRWRISRYIHDTVIQNLSLSNIRLGSMAQTLADASLTEEVDKLRQVRGLLGQAIDECRMVMSDLTPALLYELGLVSALKELAHQLEQKHGARLHVEGDEPEKSLSNPLRGLLFDSVREMIMNALKHAGPCEIRVTVKRGERDMVVRVADNGKGFDLSAAGRRDRKGGFGLLNIRQRVEGLGGRIEIESTRGQGTTAIVSVPLEAGVEE